MDIRRAVSQFIAQGTGLFHQLRSDGKGLSDVDLVTLREQLYILDTAADRLQTLKEPTTDRSEWPSDGRRIAGNRHGSKHQH
ncbi:MAG TPA: hypothetical protein VFS39_07545 [Nitrospira sp.]|nr:hypothetical protein [Nitrospira sp.]